jgi:hypothetical protein
MKLNVLKSLKNDFEKYFIPFGHLKVENSGQKQVFLNEYYKNAGLFFELIIFFNTCDNMI